MNVVWKAFFAPIESTRTNFLNSLQPLWSNLDSQARSNFLHITWNRILSTILSTCKSFTKFSAWLSRLQVDGKLSWNQESSWISLTWLYNMLTPRMDKALKTKRGLRLCLFLPNSGGQNLKLWQGNKVSLSRLKLSSRPLKEVAETLHQLWALLPPTCCSIFSTASPRIEICSRPSFIRPWPSFWSRTMPCRSCERKYWRTSSCFSRSILACPLVSCAIRYSSKLRSIWKGKNMLRTITIWVLCSNRTTIHSRWPASTLSYFRQSLCTQKFRPR